MDKMDCDMGMFFDIIAFLGVFGLLLALVFAITQV